MERSALLRIARTLAALLLAVMALGACGGGDDDEECAPPPQPSIPGWCQQNPERCR